MFAKNDNDILQSELINKNGDIIDAMTFKPSDNLSERNSNYKNSAKAYFNTNLEELSTDEYSINIYINGKLQDTVAVESKETDNYILNIDRNEWIEDEDPLIRENEKIVSISNLIIKVYKRSRGNELSY